MVNKNIFQLVHYTTIMHNEYHNDLLSYGEDERKCILNLSLVPVSHTGQCWGSQLMNLTGTTTFQCIRLLPKIRVYVAWCLLLQHKKRQFNHVGGVVEILLIIT